MTAAVADTIKHTAKCLILSVWIFMTLLFGKSNVITNSADKIYKILKIKTA